MKIASYIFILSISILYSCKESSYQMTAESIKQSIGADQLTIEESKDTVIIQVHYMTPPIMGFDFKSSSAALQLIDTSAVKFLNKGLRFVKVNIHSNKQVTEYNYPITDLVSNKSGIDIGAEFLQNFLSGRAEQNARYVDLDKVSLEELLNLNQVNEQIQSQIKIQNISFDGFTINHTEPQNIEYRGNLQGETEVFPFVFQYDKSKKRIFYFGINE
jgi:hypothetical protein